jgi:hypothetical protein
LSLGTAYVGSQSVASAKLTVLPGDVQFQVNATDVRSTSPTGGDYNPNATGPDLTLIQRIRITDSANGPSGTDEGTAQEIDYPVSVDCADTSNPAVGATCSVATTANAVLPGSVAAGKSSIWQTFRLRVYDSGPNGTRDDSDDTLFLQQGIFAP